MPSTINWNKMLRYAWKEYSTKKKADKKCIVALQSFEKNIKKHLSDIKLHLQRRDYKFGRWAVQSKTKDDGGVRYFTIPTLIRDRIVIKAISIYLSEILHYQFDKVKNISYAYLKGKNTRDALLQLKKIHKPGNVLLKLDIKHFFDTIDQDILSQLLIETTPIDDYVKELIHEIINPDLSNLTTKEREQLPQGGIPQGNPISNVLSNLYLFELDQLAISKNWNMVRYADDMVVSTSNYEEALSILSEVKTYLADSRNLSIHPLSSAEDAKTIIFQNLKAKSMTYLGIDFNGEKLSPTKKCIESLNAKIKNIINSSSNPQDTKNQINQAIKQWCGYYAFTDISNHKITTLKNGINYQIKKHKLDINMDDIAEVISKTRKRQSNRIAKRFIPHTFGKEYAWLNIYN